MGKHYDLNLETTLDLSPDQIWDTIATGPGITSWYVGHTTIDNDTIHTTLAGQPILTSTITTADRPTHFAYRTTTDPDGRFQANEFLIQGRDHSATVLRATTSGFLPGDDWADEYEAMTLGIALFHATLTEHLRHFPGRTATAVTATGPTITDWPAAWHALHRHLGLPDRPRAGDRTTDGGTVFHTNPHTLAIRTPDALHRYLRGFHGPMICDHEIYTGDTDPTPWTDLLHHLH